MKSEKRVKKLNNRQLSTLSGGCYRDSSGDWVCYKGKRNYFSTLFTTRP
jgi:hypothetical protein